MATTSTKTLSDGIPVDLSWALDDGYIDRFVRDRDVLYTVALEDATITLEGKWLLINMALWRPLVKFGLPVGTRHLFHNEDFTKAVRVRISDVIYKECIEAHPLKKAEILEEIVWSRNALYNMAITHLGKHIRTTDMFAIERTLNHEKIKPLTVVDIAAEEKVSINAVEAKLAKQNNALMDVLKNPDYKDINGFYPYVRLGAVSLVQLSQVALAAGPRTDVNDRTITTPIVSSYARGLSNIVEFAMDSLGAKKSVLYNASKLGPSQYSSRKEQLLASALHRMHPGDCGTPLVIPYEIHPKNANQVIGKHVLQNGLIVTITKANVKTFIGQTVLMRSLTVCHHTDGFCEMCGGKMVSYLDTGNTVPGLASTMEVMGPVAQLVLSNKHVSRTKSVVYELHDNLGNFLQVIRNDVYLKDARGVDDLVIGVPYTCVRRLNDLRHITHREAINDQIFTEIYEMAIAKSDGEILAAFLPMITTTKADPPYFSIDLLDFIRMNPDCIIQQDDIIWVKLKGFDRSKPLLRTIVTNDSMPAFVDRATNFISTGLAKYHSIPEALRDFSNLIYSTVHPNIFHLEVLLRASMVTSPIDARIPVVTDINNVQFGAMSRLIPRRSIGAMLAYERIKDHIAAPQTFVVPKKAGIFDSYVNFIDREQ